jgi:UDP-2-acetamido-2,6-beta-L-arabino-hexul-4-ose reductase
MRVIITGAEGFIGKNLLLRFQEIDNMECISFTRSNSVNELPELLEEVDWVFHLAGINRPKSADEFATGNVDLTESLCSAIKATGRLIPVVFSSSIQVDIDNDYGKSKRAAEDALLGLQKETGNPVFIYRLPNVFGKLARPNFNSAVATFCYNIARDLPIQINDPSIIISLVYIDDVVENFERLLFEANIKQDGFVTVLPTFNITLGHLVDQLYRFKASRDNLLMEPVGKGLIRALYSTYVSYLSPKDFSYPVKQHEDERGTLVEMLKTKNSGQFSFFTAHPGVTRGGHYHNSKTEKFLVIKGKAQFRFRHIVTDEFHELFTSSDYFKVVDTVPGWTHDITNIGKEELICLLWANEVFDSDKKDTFSSPIQIDT